ncbi:MAG: phosphoglucosamine mutase [Mesoaciditoga sp.]|uniref:phosphoglucosamine mutase n=1 Tax=Athalassotoga sp. TaxID=2022597 RepID=UPI000CB1AB11|nr:MAG: phosphoglucosamine mutase [Mesoaciditoga sp.]PMP80342.1 MAG: phosphoglucosamine mutase [Mesoaciditoga sp.]HEU25063.1 phosphoglucosamine mutase [Mesoaciditoga lauensis]
MKKYFGTDGVRGIANEELTAELAFKIGRAASYVLLSHNHKFKEILIARDTRISGEMIESALTSGLLSMGLNVTLCGIMPTPTLAWLTKKEETVGFMVSASHNPWQHNGIKIFSNGYKLPDSIEEEIEEALDKVSYGHSVGRIVNHDMLSEYIEWIVKRYVDLKGETIAFDLANGAAISTVPVVAREIGIKSFIFNDKPDGMNINEKCGALYLDFMKKAILTTSARYGVVNDGDADRCMIVSRDGRIIDGDDIMVLNALSMKDEGRLNGNTVIGTIMTNLSIEEFLSNNGIKFLRTPVGDRYVLEKMIETDSHLGGEQSGHVIFLDLESTGDGLVTALETFRAARKLKVDPSEFVSKIGRYHQILENIEVKDKLGVMEDGKVKTFMDRIKKEKNVRVVLRPSGTEPLIRIMVEGRDEKRVEEIMKEAKEIIEEVKDSGAIHKN